MQSANNNPETTIEKMQNGPTEAEPFHRVVADVPRGRSLKVGG